MHTCPRVLLPLIAALLLVPVPLLGQAVDPEQALRVERLEARPASVVVEAGSSVPLEVIAYDAAGEVVDAPIRLGGARGALRVGDGQVFGLAAGQYEIFATVVLPPDAGREPPMLSIPVRITWPPVTEVEIEVEPGRLYEGTTLRHRVTAGHADGSERPAPDVSWHSSDARVATVDRFGNVTAHAAGPVTIAAVVEDVRAEAEYSVASFPAAQLDIAGGAELARTGDVLAFEARALDAQGRPVEDLPVTWSYTYDPGEHDIRAAGATAEVRDGEFVAELPGQFTIIALSGPLSARTTVEIESRGVVQRSEVVGQGAVQHAHTSDFWVFEGRDGRDYAITGTWGANGFAYMWDVTDPTSLVKTDSVQVDARTVNDVKVSPDARYATMTREGASNRRNGVVILDLAEPAHPKIASVVDEGLTGGVHNAFPAEDYVYALSAGQKYLIIDVTDIYNPRTVGEYQHEDCRIHDVWVHDGIAYSAQWGCGIIVVDVGNGRWGGTPQNPVFVAQAQTPGGNTHAVFPYYQESTGIFYVYAGDEIMSRRGRALDGGLHVDPYDPETGRGGRPSGTAGYVHIIDFSDPAHPKKVAKYEVPEYGTHNIWVENDVLYQAYYEGGMRVVDVSGELRGNLARQDREIAVVKSHDPIGYIPNAPMVWSAMPYKGYIFFSDWNSGLWAVQLGEDAAPITMR